jgi:ABC-type multidrug transport system fused ATPase/permease subunit
MPLVFLPFVLSALSDAIVALRRIGSFLTAEDLPKPYDIKDELKGIAIDAEGDFAWETVDDPNASGESGKFGHSKKGSKKGGKKDSSRKNGGDVLPRHNSDPEKVQPGDGAQDQRTGAEETSSQEEKPFELKNVNLKIPKGAFIGIVGRVGSGKSSLLQALIGEMRKTKGHVSIVSVPLCCRIILTYWHAFLGRVRWYCSVCSANTLDPERVSPTECVVWHGR